MRANKIRAALSELVAAEILTCVEVGWFGVEGRGQYSYEWGFASSPIRAAVYSSMTYNIRTTMHKTLTQYYQLAYQNDASHFASIICYHAEATGDVDTAVKSSLRAANEHMRNSAYSSALENIQRCIGILENHTKTVEDRTLLVSCFMREAHLFLATDRIDEALNSLSASELVCKHQFQTPLPHATVAVGSEHDSGTAANSSEGGSRGGAGGGGLLGKLFSCFRRTKLKRMHGVIVRSMQEIRKMRSMALSTGGISRITKDYDMIMAIMGRLQHGYTIKGTVPDDELLISGGNFAVRVQETLAHAKAAGLKIHGASRASTDVDADSAWVSKVERDRKPVSRKSVVGLVNNEGGASKPSTQLVARALSSPNVQNQTRSTM